MFFRTEVLNVAGRSPLGAPQQQLAELQGRVALRSSRCGARCRGGCGRPPQHRAPPSPRLRRGQPPRCS